MSRNAASKVAVGAFFLLTILVFWIGTNVPHWIVSAAAVSDISEPVYELRTWIAKTCVILIVIYTVVIAIMKSWRLLFALPIIMMVWIVGYFVMMGAIQAATCEFTVLRATNQGAILSKEGNRFLMHLESSIGCTFEGHKRLELGDLPEELKSVLCNLGVGCPRLIQVRKRRDGHLILECFYSTRLGRLPMLHLMISTLDDGVDWEEENLLLYGKASQLEENVVINMYGCPTSTLRHSTTGTGVDNSLNRISDQ